MGTELTRGKIAKKIEDKGFGFIDSGINDSYFFHTSQCVTPFEELKVGNEVVFETEKTPKGMRAIGVEKL